MKLATLGNTLIESCYNRQRYFKILVKKSRLMIISQSAKFDEILICQDLLTPYPFSDYLQYIPYKNKIYASKNCNNKIQILEKEKFWQTKFCIDHGILYTDQITMFLFKHNELWDLETMKILQCFPGPVVSIACDYLNAERYICWTKNGKYYIFNSSGALELILDWQPLAMHVFYYKHKFLIIRRPDYHEKKFKIHKFS